MSAWEHVFKFFSVNSMQLQLCSILMLSVYYANITAMLLGSGLLANRCQPANRF